MEWICHSLLLIWGIREHQVSSIPFTKTRSPEMLSNLHTIVHLVPVVVKSIGAYGHMMSWPSQRLPLGRLFQA